MKKLWGVVFLLAAAGLAFAYASQQYSEKAFTPENLIRIHVVANSDSDQDQAIKIKVKDRLVHWLSPELAKADSTAESRAMLEEKIDDIVKVACCEVRENSAEYGARAIIGDFDFPTRQYGELVLPQGKYHALRVVLGEGKGHNWWCVLYPPLCLEKPKAQAPPKPQFFLSRLFHPSGKRNAITQGPAKRIEIN
ncbi:MAG: stage II sporulation protein R [Candidatus Saccharibacteria bacterium]